MPQLSKENGNKNRCGVGRCSIGLSKYVRLFVASPKIKPVAKAAG